LEIQEVRGDPVKKNWIQFDAEVSKLPDRLPPRVISRKLPKRVRWGFSYMCYRSRRGW